jgi:RNA polymerase sigma-70 factor, ECF subfamily
MILFADPAPALSSAGSQSERAALARKEAIYDSGLVNRFNGGDETAFAEIMTRYQPRMYSVALALLQNRADAEEIAQDTFIRAHRALGKFRGDASLATWLHRITLNLSRNRYWYFFRRCRQSTLSLECAFKDDSRGTFSDLVASGAAGPAREAVASEFSEIIAACMKRLDAPARVILDLRNSMNRSYDEIARELGINVGTVKSRIARARENLRVLLVAACPEFGPDARPTAWFESIRPAGGIEVIAA